MYMEKQIQSALISVYHKDGLAPVVKKLHEHGITIYSTGGTAAFIREQNIPVTTVESITSYPSILGGRVKTLHPKVFGGILARQTLAQDREDLVKYDIPQIDMVMVDLYPFGQTVASGASDEEAIEKIDIGGISLIRAAAKNYYDLLVISNQGQYRKFLRILEKKGPQTSLEERKIFAAEAFHISSHYDTLVFNWLNRENLVFAWKDSFSGGKKLRYGENPHQQGYFYGDFESLYTQLHGKEISYNNLLDIDAAESLVAEFNETVFAVLKHNNACGIAAREKLIEAWTDALAGDPVSAFGGILSTNVEVNAETAEGINKIFFEVIIAPGYTDEALKILEQKKNRIILIRKSFGFQSLIEKSALNGVLVQERDSKVEASSDLKTVTKRQPSEAEIRDLLFANKVVKHSKSNAIVLVKNQQLVGNGIGQTSRVDALKQAIAKADSFNLDLHGAVMASDAFFPFADSVELADKAGITTVIQPGGSVRDQESIDYCDNHNMSMVFTGIRHFKH
ncbi:MAG: bifunctional phosphoribosylaminoimidazolecarboxamide formyltransferase/IMP cyclohydrolase [Chlorobi bacterium]|nr:bifunctional phosphoribosylaminoimidazolecarboxamide formyltransferase/IMP cyclohydrolase [Chlorobiota bacterium]